MLLQTLAYGDRTKKQLALALGNCLKTEAFDKISIRELADCCGIRRQSFYYHFEDIYSLLKYGLSLCGETILGLENGDQRQTLLALFRMAGAHRAAYFSLMGSSAAHCTESWLRGLLQNILEQVIVSTAAQLELPAPEEDSVRTLAQYYSIFLAGMLDNRLRAEKPEPPETLLALMDKMLCNQLLGAHTQAAAGKADVQPQEGSPAAK